MYLYVRYDYYYYYNYCSLKKNKKKNNDHINYRLFSCISNKSFVILYFK